MHLHVSLNFFGLDRGEEQGGKDTPQPSLAPLEGLTFKQQFLGQARKPRVGRGVGGLLFHLPVADANNRSILLIDSFKAYARKKKERENKKGVKKEPTTLFLRF